MASCSCGTRDKPKPVSPLSRGLWSLGCYMRLAFRNGAEFVDVRRSWSLWAWGAALLKIDFLDMPENLLQLLVLHEKFWL